MAGATLTAPANIGNSLVWLILAQREAQGTLHRAHINRYKP